MDLDVDSEALSREGVRLAVLFGSRARGTAGATSDIDVGVYLGSSDRIDLDQFDRLRSAISGRGELDLVVLDHADPLLLYEAAVDGRPFYEASPGTWEEFRILAVKRYYDTAWIRKIEAEALRARHGSS